MLIVASSCVHRYAVDAGKLRKVLVSGTMILILGMRILGYLESFKVLLQQQIGFSTS